jgi:hypothetical protein
LHGWDACDWLPSLTAVKEVGVSPARSRHCHRGVIPPRVSRPLLRLEGRGRASIREPGYFGRRACPRARTPEEDPMMSAAVALPSRLSH